MKHSGLAFFATVYLVFSMATSCREQASERNGAVDSEAGSVGSPTSVDPKVTCGSSFEKAFLDVRSARSITLPSDADIKFGPASGRLAIYVEKELSFRCV